MLTSFFKFLLIVLKPSFNHFKGRERGEGGYFTTDGQSVSQSVCLSIERSCGTCEQILLPVVMLLSEICGLVSVGRPLSREDGSEICSVSTQWSESRRTCNRSGSRSYFTNDSPSVSQSVSRL
jgi:hypothetical protein